jgi:hypothetical protein
MWQLLGINSLIRERERERDQIVNELMIKSPFINPRIRREREIRGRLHGAAIEMQQHAGSESGGESLSLDQRQIEGIRIGGRA